AVVAGGLTRKSADRHAVPFLQSVCRWCRDGNGHAVFGSTDTVLTRDGHALGSTDNGLSRDGHAADEQVRLEGAGAHLVAGSVDRDGLDVDVVDGGPLDARGVD